MYDVKEVGRIFSEKNFNLDEKFGFTFFTSSPSPPTVYEFNVDEHMNVVIQKIYQSLNYELLRYIGNDAISVTDYFVALLVYDYKTQRQAVRIFYRRGTNYGIGHTDIQLRSFDNEISAMTFIGYTNFYRLYVRNSLKWSIFEVSDTELVINTYVAKDDYLKLINGTYDARIQVCYTPK